tara:strand:- start:167 stop:508 length:342 start_codon:yes stop_codon:yes gene_type:complete
MDFFRLQPAAVVRVMASSPGMSDPEKWSGDWKARKGRYVSKPENVTLAAGLDLNERLLVAMAFRGATNGQIGEALGVSREAIGRRLRPLGVNTTRGGVRSTVAGVSVPACILT